MSEADFAFSFLDPIINTLCGAFDTSNTEQKREKPFPQEKCGSPPLAPAQHLSAR
jgi:hypothetical protein